MVRRRNAQPITARSSFEQRHVSELRSLARLVGDARGRRKADLVDRLVEHLEGPGLIEVIDGLDDLQYETVDHAVRSTSGSLDVVRARALHGDEETRGVCGTNSLWSTEIGPLALLFDPDGALPLDLQLRLREILPEPEAPSVATVESLPDCLEVERPNRRPDSGPRSTRIDRVTIEVVETEVCARRELAGVLGLVDSASVGVSARTRIPSAAGQRAVAGVLDGGDYYDEDEIGLIKPFAWPLLLQAAGLVEITGGRLRLTPRGRKALRHPPEKTLRDIWRRWQKATFFDELRRIDSIKGQTERGHTVSGLRGFLETGSDEPLPSVVDRLLRDVEERAGSVTRVGPAVLFECRDTALARLIAHDSRAGKLCELAGDSGLVVSAGMEDRFRRAVRRLGYVATGNGGRG